MNEENEKRPKSAVSNKVHPFNVDDTGKWDNNEGGPQQPAEKRDNWGGKLDFFFSALSFSGSIFFLLLTQNIIILS